MSTQARRGGFSAHAPKLPNCNRHDRKDLSARRNRRPHLRGLGGGRRLQGRPSRAARRQALLHRHPAAERDRLAAHRPRAQQHAAGRAEPLRAHARHATCCGSRAPTTPASPPRWWSSASLLERQQPSRRDMGREKFVERSGSGRPRSGGTIVNQLKRLGASCDWSRERFTMDEGLSRAVAQGVRRALSTRA